MAGARFVTVSTDLVFDGHKRAPYVETDDVGRGIAVGGDALVVIDRIDTADGNAAAAIFSQDEALQDGQLMPDSAARRRDLYLVTPAASSCRAWCSTIASPRAIPSLKRLTSAAGVAFGATTPYQPIVS